MQQLKVLTDLSVLPREIHSNYEAVKAELEDALKKYDGLVVTDENIKEMKNMRAEINKGISVIEKCGTDTKKLLLAPFLPFDVKVKELAQLAEEKKNALDKQIKEIEARKRKEKRETLCAYVKEVVAGQAWDAETYSALSVFENLVDSNPQWLNLTYTERKAREEIKDFVEKCSSAVDQIHSIYAADLEVVKVKAKQFIIESGFDVGKACVKINAFKAEEERLAEARRQDEERRKKEAEARELARVAEEARKAEEAKRAAEAAANAPHDLPPVHVQQDAGDGQSAMSRAKEMLRAARVGVSGGQGAPAPIVNPNARKDDSAVSSGDPAVAALKPSVYRTVMRFYGPIGKLRELRDFMKANDIRFEVIESPAVVESE